MALIIRSLRALSVVLMFFIPLILFQPKTSLLFSAILPLILLLPELLFQIKMFPLLLALVQLTLLAAEHRQGATHVLLFQPLFPSLLLWSHCPFPLVALSAGSPSSDTSFHFLQLRVPPAVTGFWLLSNHSLSCKLTAVILSLSSCQTPALFSFLNQLIHLIWHHFLQ